MMNPINMLFNVMKSRGINIPANVNMNDPNAIINYLLQSGKISQDQYNRAYSQSKQYQSMMNGTNNSQQVQ